MTNTKQYTNLKIEKLEKGEIKLGASVSAETVESFHKKALEHYKQNVEVDGFRKGKTPEDVVIKNIGDTVILEKAAQMALDEIYPQIIIDEKISAIGAPQIEIKKLALGNDLEFTARTAVMPEVTLPDYKKIAKKEMSKKGDVEVTDKDVEDVLNNIKKERVRIENYEAQKKDGVEKPSVMELHEVKEEDLKDLDDEFVATLGDFKTVADFEKHVREGVGKEKQLKDKEKKRIAMMEEIIKQSKIELPELLIAHEVARMKQQLEAELARSGADFDGYLKHINKTEEDVMKEWRPEAEKRAKLQLILNKIAAENELEPKKEDVEHELKHLLEHYPDADKGGAQTYIETMKRNEMVFDLLENNK